jgi:hypothetical protein
MHMVCYGFIFVVWTIWLGIELRRIKKSQIQPPIPKRGPPAAMPPSDEIGGTSIPIAEATAVTEGVPPSSSPVAATSSLPVVIAVSPTGVSPTSPVVVPALAPPPRSAQAIAAQAALDAFAAPAATTTTASSLTPASSTSTPPFSFAASTANPPSPIPSSAAVAAPMSSTSIGGGNDLDFLSGGLSSSFVAIDTPAAPMPSSSSSSSYDMLSGGIGGVPTSTSPMAIGGVPSSPAVAEAPSVASSISGVVFGNCDQHAATVHCGQCDGDLCNACNDTIHATGLLKKHKRVPIA